MKTRLWLLIIASVLYSNITFAFTTPYFYSAHYLPNPPRYDYDWLSTGYVQLAGGSTCKARNACGETVPLLALYTPDGKLRAKCAGIFDVFEANIDLVQNLTCGLFLEFYIPIRVIHFHPLFIKSSKTTDYAEYLKEDGIEAMISRLDHYMHTLHKGALADCALLLGWTHTWHQDNILDFVDTSFQAGMLFPTDKTKCIYDFFCIPYGYNGHYGIPFTGDVAFGLFDWFTWGLHGDLFVFLSKHKKSTIYTAENLPCCFNKRIKPGILGRFSTYATADHFMKGLSITLGYSYVNKTHDKIETHSPLHTLDIACQDPTIKSWRMHTLHLFIEYDFSQDDCLFGPRIAFIYNRQLAGKRVFQTNIAGAQLTAECSWQF